MAASSELSLTATLPMQHSSARMPVLGLGVWDSAASVCASTCQTALKNGYRHIDTAQAYGNESEVGQGIEASGVPRSDIFVTTKINAPGDGGPESTYEKCVRSVDKLGGYADLFLVHTPLRGPKAIKEMWRALERLHKEGKAKAIGVSNFNGRHIDAMRDYATVWPPAVNQLELHPWMQQREVVDYCVKNKIVVQAYSPLIRMRKAEDPTLVQIAQDTGTSGTQVLVRYSLEKGWVPLPKSDKEQRIRQNANVFDFKLSAEQMRVLDAREEEDGKLCLCYDAAKL